MPFKDETMFMQKQKFVALYETGKFSMAELCRDFGISRRTGYNVLEVYKEHGEEGLRGLSKTHKTHPQSTPGEVVDDIVTLRKKYRHWGAKKIRHLLLERWEGESVPSLTTVNLIMKKNGLVLPRKRRLTRVGKIDPQFDPEFPNQIMSADFKGKFRMQNGVYCYPLTIADSKSRFVFAAEALDRGTTELSRPVFDRVFREFGLPEMIHTDNGAPFGCVNSLRRMTFLSVWFMELGITPVYSDPGCPTQNGRHERMHRDLKAEATRPAGKNLVDQQRKFDRFIYDFNNIRPHEALEMKRPSMVHEKSLRTYDGRIFSWDYDKEFDVRMVSKNGLVRWKTDRWLPISTALCGKMIGMKEVMEGIYELYYRHVLLGYFSDQTGKTYEVEVFDL